jgi:amino acid transporter
MKSKPASQYSSLPRVLGRWMTTAIVIGTLIGSGVFKKPAAVAKDVPEFLPAMLVWVLGGVLLILGALALAEVAVLFPRAGGNYVFLREGYGRAFGFLWGWVEFWIIRSGSIAALATIFTESLCELLEYIAVPAGQQVAFWPRQYLTIATIIALAAVNIRGVRWGGTLQVIVTTVKIGSLVAISVLPFVSVLWTEPKPLPAEPVAPSWGVTNFLAATVGVIWAYHGWMNFAAIAGEVERPKRTLPFALFIGAGVIMALYLGANFAYHQSMTSHEMKNLPQTTSVLAECSRRWLGPLGGAAAAAVLMTSVFGALNGNIMVGPRLLFAMGEDGLAPASLQRLHARFQTPALAIAVLSGWSALMVLVVAVWIRNPLPVAELSMPNFLPFLYGGSTIPLKLDPNLSEKGAFDTITDFAMFGAIGFETLAVLSIFSMRRKWPDADRPYRCPGYPLIPAVYGLIMLGVWLNYFITKRIEAITAIVIIAVGVAVYCAFLRKSSPA